MIPPRPKNLPVASLMHPTRWMTAAEEKFWITLRDRPFLARAFEYISIKTWHEFFASHERRGELSETPRWSIDAAASAVRYAYHLPEFAAYPRDDFVMGNDLRPFFARWVMTRHPKLEGFYEIRRQFSNMGDPIELDVGLPRLPPPPRRDPFYLSVPLLLAPPPEPEKPEPLRSRVNGRLSPVLPVDGRIRTRVR